MKCDRCGDFKELFQYTKFEVKWISWIENRGKGYERFAVRNDIGEKRGLCKECAIELNKRKYDLALIENPELLSPLPTSLNEK